MIHTFECLGTYILLDVESGAVYSVDKLIFDIASLMERHFGEEEMIAKLSALYSNDDISDALSEIRELEAQGAFNSQSDSQAVKEAAARNKNVIKSMCLHMAHDCNLRCQYCFASTGDFHGERALMPLDVAKAAMDFLIASSGSRRNLEVDFFGGEPLMNFEVVKKTVEYGRSLEKQHDKNIRFTITTNGLLLNQDILDFINREMNNVVVSIDGRPEVHNRMRKTVKGGPSFDLVAPNALKIAQSRGQEKYYVRGTFTAYNTDFSKDAEFLADYGFKQLSLEPVVTDEKDEYALTEKHLNQLYQEYEKLARIYLDRSETDKSFNFFHFMLDLSGGPCLVKRVTGCGAGNEYVAVTPSGDIYPCHQFAGNPETRMGNVLDGTFNTQAQKKYKSCNVLNKEECSNCWAKYYCSGGCAANAYIYNGDINKPYKMACLLEKKRLECALAIYAIKHLKEGIVND